MLDYAKIKEARIALGLKQMFVAERVGVSQAHYCNIENGRENPSLPTLEAIAAVLNKTVGYFLIPDLDPTVPRAVAPARRRLTPARELGTAGA